MNQFRLYDTELSKKITEDARKILMNTINGLVEDGGYKRGQMIVWCGKGGRPRWNELQEDK